MDWQNYPDNSDLAVTDAYDRDFYRRRLLTDASRLFTSNTTGLRLVYMAAGAV
jgi:hypothetical protein